MGGGGFRVFRVFTSCMMCAFTSVAVVAASRQSGPRESH